MSIESNFLPSFVASLALHEKQVQQAYRPIIGIHKWFARRPGTLFRSLLLSEYALNGNLSNSYFLPHKFTGVIADPFMGGGIPIVEANRLGFHVLGCDINPMAHWIVSQELATLDIDAFQKTANLVAADVEKQIGRFYKTQCIKCGDIVPVKYFIWVKTKTCPSCHKITNLFPGHLIAENSRHPNNVLICPHCLSLSEYSTIPKAPIAVTCPSCNKPFASSGNAVKRVATCIHCDHKFKYLDDVHIPLEHRLCAIEYYCPRCKPTHIGRFFKSPDIMDHKNFSDTTTEFKKTGDRLPIPQDEIPQGDETTRLHTWGYTKYSQLFNSRQLIGLGMLLDRILKEPAGNVRNALLTVFSDSLRYQNMLCRYDTYALKCQDIFSVHSFPVGLIQCENNLLGIAKVGSGSFRHFIEKYARAKDFCVHPYEIHQVKKVKKKIHIPGETIAAELVNTFPKGIDQCAFLYCGDSSTMILPKDSLDGIFTDPPYFDNLQYSELIDFCYIWLRQALKDTYEPFEAKTTRSKFELTGNKTLHRGLVHFTHGLSQVFQKFSAALKPNGPFVFTYHHNNLSAYGPIVISLLDSRLYCLATIPAPAEMSASLHINNTSSSILDSVFVSRKPINSDTLIDQSNDVNTLLIKDCKDMAAAGVNVTIGDIRCLRSGHIARIAIKCLFTNWDVNNEIPEKIAIVQKIMEEIEQSLDSKLSVGDILLQIGKSQP